jgi:cytochrome c biogenesis protein CcmG/thiol:disulfide interchange protein DsbE
MSNRVTYGLSMLISRQILLALCLLFTLVVSSGAAATDVAPDWTLTTPAGESVNLAEVAGDQTTILFFWATWCPYCKALMPHLQSIRLEYGDEVRILAINIFEDADPVEFMANAGYDFTLLLEGDEVAELYDVKGTPGAFVLNRDRQIAFDLTKLPRVSPPDNGKKASNSRRAAYAAPYWAAEIRKSIDATQENAK